MLEAPTLDSLIVKNEKLHSGRPIIAGTGITVRGVVGLYKLGLSAEDIIGELPLNLAQVYAALTYYHLHTEEIEADIRADSEAALKEKYGSQLNG